jgi:hypothetical protein
MRPIIVIISIYYIILYQLMHLCLYIMCRWAKRWGESYDRCLWPGGGGKALSRDVCSCPGCNGRSGLDCDCVSPFEYLDHAFARLFNSPKCVRSPIQSASASNKKQTDRQSVALIIVAPFEDDRLLGWISTPLA